MTTETEPTPAPAEPPEPSHEEMLMLASAGYGIRFLARFVDLLFSMVLSLLVGLFAGLVFGVMQALGKLPADWVERVQQNSYHVIAFGLLGAFLYHSFSEGICGATVGKLVCGLHVVQTDGRPCTVAGAFKRDLAYHWDALFVGLIGYASMKDSPTQQRYGDKWAQTVVVRKIGLTAQPAHPAWRFPAGIITGSLFWMLCEFAGLLLKVTT